jgi:rhodanese-related sulfurtransferase
MRRLRYLLLALLLAGLLPQSLLPSAPALAEDYYQTIPLAEVARVMNQPGVMLLDLNVPEVWDKYHIPGAVHVDNADIGRFLPPDRNATLIFYCAGPMCSAAGMAANESVKLGYRKVFVMHEGIFAWVRLGFPALAGAPLHKRN